MTSVLSSLLFYHQLIKQGRESIIDCHYIACLTMGGGMEALKETKDLVEKEFLAFPDIAADVINALLYQGKEAAKPENLMAGPTESIYLGEKKLRNQYEDLCKYEITNGRINLMYLIANQSKSDGKMLLRKAGYIGGIYREQYEKKMKEIFPVIELILYWEYPRWRGSRDIQKLFQNKRLSEETWKFIDNMNLHVFEMRHLPKEIRELFQSDMRIVVDFLAEGNSYRSDRKIAHKAALIRMIITLSGEPCTENIEAWLKQHGIREEEELTVCELFDQYIRQGKIEGKTEGRAEGENRLAKLVQVLMDNGRNEDLKKALSDQSYREQLYMEAGLI